MTADGLDHQLTINGSNFAVGNVVQFMYGQGQGANVWTNSKSSPAISSPNQITLSVNPGTVQDTFLVRVCASNGSTNCSGTQSFTVKP